MDRVIQSSTFISSFFILKKGQTIREIKHKHHIRSGSVGYSVLLFYLFIEQKQQQKINVYDMLSNRKTTTNQQQPTTDPHNKHKML